ncbi:MAG TPA: S26 family signal peptidase [Actinomycetota bacterium]|nr:S26 family signal peptidase [Actinomycetota bacterium]
MTIPKTRTQRYHGRPERALARALALGGALVALAVVALRPFRVAVEGRSMEPTLAPGDFLLASRTLPPWRGALAVVEHPERPGYELVKRVQGLAWDRVGGRTLGPGELWVVGDHPLATTDSRAFGPVVRGAVRGVVLLRYWPPGRAAWLARPR